MMQWLEEKKSYKEKETRMCCYRQERGRDKFMGFIPVFLSFYYSKSLQVY